MTISLYDLNILERRLQSALRSFKGRPPTTSEGWEDIVEDCEIAYNVAKDILGAVEEDEESERILAARQEEEEQHESNG